MFAPSSPSFAVPHPALQWHPAINQIFVGCGGRSTGCVRTFYDPKLSTKGALLAAGRAPRAQASDFMHVRVCAVCCGHRCELQASADLRAGQGGAGRGGPGASLAHAVVAYLHVPRFL